VSERQPCRLVPTPDHGRIKKIVETVALFKEIIDNIKESGGETFKPVCPLPCLLKGIY